MFKLIWKIIERKKGAERVYKKYQNTETSPLLKRVAAECTREAVRDCKKKFKRISKTN